MFPDSSLTNDNTTDIWNDNSTGIWNDNTDKNLNRPYFFLRLVIVSQSAERHDRIRIPAYCNASFMRVNFFIYMC